MTARLKSDGEVDVLPTVRYVHTVLPTAVTSQVRGGSGSVHEYSFVGIKVQLRLGRDI